MWHTFEDFILFIILEGIIKIISYDSFDYESVVEAHMILVDRGSKQDL